MDCKRQLEASVPVETSLKKRKISSDSNSSNSSSHGSLPSIPGVVSSVDYTTGETIPCLLNCGVDQNLTGLEEHFLQTTATCDYRLAKPFLLHLSKFLATFSAVQHEMGEETAVRLLTTMGERTVRAILKEPHHTDSRERRKAKDRAIQGITMANSLERMGSKKFLQPGAYTDLKRGIFGRQKSTVERGTSKDDYSHYPRPFFYKFECMMCDEEVDDLEQMDEHYRHHAPLLLEKQKTNDIALSSYGTTSVKTNVDDLLADSAAENDITCWSSKGRSGRVLFFFCLTVLIVSLVAAISTCAALYAPSLSK